MCRLMWLRLATCVWCLSGSISRRNHRAVPVAGNLPRPLKSCGTTGTSQLDRLAVFPSLKGHGRTHIGSRPAVRISTDTTRASPVVAGFAVSEVPDEASDLLVPPIASSFPEADSVFFFVGDERGHPTRTFASKVFVPRLDQTCRDALPTKVGEHGQAVHVARQPSQAAIRAPTISPSCSATKRASSVCAISRETERTSSGVTAAGLRAWSQSARTRRTSSRRATRMITSSASGVSVKSATVAEDAGGAIRWLGC